MKVPLRAVAAVPALSTSHPASRHAMSTQSVVAASLHHTCRSASASQMLRSGWTTACKETLLRGCWSCRNSHGRVVTVQPIAQYPCRNPRRTRCSWVPTSSQRTLSWMRSGWVDHLISASILVQSHWVPAPAALRDEVMSASVGSHGGDLFLWVCMAKSCCYLISMCGPPHANFATSKGCCDGCHSVRSTLHQCLPGHAGTRTLILVFHGHDC